MSTRRHTGYNLIGAIAPILLMLVTVPLYLRALGEVRYGILAIVWLLTGYFNFFDFGLGRATAFAIARHKGASDDVRAKTFWTALIVNSLFGLIGAAILLALAGPLFLHVFNTPPEVRAELMPVLPWLALSVPLLTLEGVFTGALTGRERFLLLNMRTTIGTAITQILPLFFVWYLAPTLTVAIPATLFARAISVALLAAIAFRAVPAGIRPNYGGHALARELLGYGGWVSLASALNPIIANLDRFLIAAFMPASAIAFYTVPFQLVTRGVVFSNALATALFPRLARMEPEEARRLAERAVRANAALMTVLCVAGILIMQPFLSLWINQGFAEKAALVGQLIALSLWLNAIALVPFNLLQAQGRPRATTTIMMIQTVPFVALAVPGILWWGIAGAALARNFRSVVDVAMLTHRTGLLRSTTRLAVFPFALMIGSIAAAQIQPAITPRGIVLALALIGAATVWAAFTSRQMLAPLARQFNIRAANFITRKNT